jgi:hypothetical protein
MPEWPPIEEPELRRRLALDEDGFAEFIGEPLAGLPARECDGETVARAISYPWARPLGSYLLPGDGGIEALAAQAPERRRATLDRFTGAETRLPVLAIGSNGAPAALERKFTHFSAPEDRAVLVLSGRLHDFDVGVAAQPALYGSLPATLFASPGTAVGAALLWVTPAQFTQLAWSELNYRLGRLRARFEVAETAAHFDQVLVFVSRFGTFAPDGEPVALAAIPAAGRTAPELSEKQLLDRAAALALGPGADAERLIRAVFARPGATAARIAATVHPASLPFASSRWTPFPAPVPG